MSKIVFFDIDGTLLDRDKRLPRSAKDAVSKLKEKGVHVAIATGRAPFMFKELREELGIQSYVCLNGQYVVFENEVIYEKPIDRVHLERMLNDSAKNGHPLVYLDHERMKATVDYHPFIEKGLASLKFPHPEEDKHYYRDTKVFQALLFCEKKDEEKYRKEYPELKFIRWHKYSTDILPRNGSKAEGIRKMIRRLGFQLENVYAFGDGLNDIEMIQEVGTGVAMGNAAPSLKEYADHITADVDDDGIWKGLKKLNLI